MKVLINFASEDFIFSQKLNSFTGKCIGGFDKVIEYSSKDIDQDFYLSNKEIFDTKRGAGLWLWKPYFILKTLKTLNEDDVLFYCDSGSFFLRNIYHLTREMESQKLNIFISFTPHISKNWTRKYVFDFLKINSEEYFNSLQPCAGYILLKKNKYSEAFVEEWLSLCRNFDLIRDVIQGEENFSDFKDHRHDQSLLAIVAKKYKLEHYKDISQFGNEPFYFETFAHTNLPEKKWSYRGQYPTIVMLYRTGGLLKSTIMYLLKLLIYNINKSIYYKLVSMKPANIKK